MTSSVHPQHTTTYPVGNWPAYDRALVQRGEITVWLAPDAIAAWEAVGVGTRGGQRPYSDLAIEPALTLRLIFPLPLRQTDGCLTSLVGRLGLALSAPDHTRTPGVASSSTSRCVAPPQVSAYISLSTARASRSWAKLEEAASRCRPIGCDRRLGPHGGERRRRDDWDHADRGGRRPPSDR